MTFEQVAGWSALLAAAATIVGMVTLLLFFSRGDPWGIRNDIASIVLMLTTIPVALLVGAIELEQHSTTALVVTGVGIAGMLAAAGLQTALVARLRTYEQLLPWTLSAGAVVGLWYLLAGVLALPGGLEPPLPWLAIASGAGFIAVGYGFAAGGHKHPLSAIGGIVLFIGSTTFLTWLGFQLVSGALVVPIWNA